MRGGDAINKFQRCEDQIALFSARLRFRAVIDQISTTLVKPLHGQGWPSAIAQQSLQPGAVSRGNAYGGINRKRLAFQSRLTCTQVSRN